VLSQVDQDDFYNPIVNVVLKFRDKFYVKKGEGYVQHFRYVFFYVLVLSCIFYVFLCKKFGKKKIFLQKTKKATKSYNKKKPEKLQNLPIKTKNLKNLPIKNKKATKSSYKKQKSYKILLLKSRVNKI